LPNEHISTLNALGSAIQSEIEGKELYLKMSHATGNAMGQKLFQNLAIEEDFHRQKFELIYKDIAAQKNWPDIVVEKRAETLKTVFSAPFKNVKYSTSELEAVQKAMEMENKTRDFYLTQSKKATFPAEKKYYDELAAEERIHHTLLQDYYEYVQDPAQYFTIKEKHSLDG
jgi:rubrerythrin